MDYAIPHQRKSKKDQKRKRLYRVYKKGGKFRTVKFVKKEENLGDNKS